MQDLDKILRSLKETLESSKPLGPFSYDQVSKWEKKTKIQVPFFRKPKPGSDEYSHASFSYAAPVSINVTGGYAIKACLSPHQADMIVEMPSEIFKEKDHLNYRYFHKRAFYLACMYSVLKEANIEDASIEFDDIDSLKPYLLVKLQDGSSIRLLPFTKALKPFRLAADRSCVRASVFHEQIADGSGDLEDSPTPNINSAMLSDVLFTEQLKWIKSVSKKVPQFAEGLKLVKAWLKQRSLEGVYGRLSGFHVSVLLGFMVQQGLIDETMDELHILKVFLKYFGELDFDKSHSLCEVQPEVPEEFKDSFSLDTFRNHFEVVFVDSTGYMNLFWNVSKAALRLSQMEAKRHYSLIMADPKQAQLLLLTPDDIQVKFDVNLTITKIAESASLDSLDGRDISKIAKTLQRALTDRITHICSRIEGNSMKIGLLLNPENAFRLVDLGPPVEDKEGCARFRQFWGSKSELRRFKDSSIKETAVWEEFAKERHLIVGVICQYILKLHCSIEDVKFDSGRLDFAVERGTFAPVIVATEDLAKRLRAGFKTLPLTIVAVESISPAGRYTDVVLPQPLSSLKAPKSGRIEQPVPVHELVVRVEGSGKWPQDPHAAKLLKQAFILQLSRGLSEEHHLETSFATDYLDVCFGEYIFRCHFTFAGELALLKRHGIDTVEFERLTVHLPKHARAIHGLYTSNVVFGPTVRLAKRFVASQYLSSVFPEELVELMMARVFVHPERNAEPHSPMAGFVRFLQLIAQFDWEASSLMVNFDKSNKEAMAYDRSTYCLHVSTSYDEEANPWSLPVESAAALSELKRLSSAALKYIASNEDLTVLFRRSTKGFTCSLPINQEHQLSKTSMLAVKNASISADFLRFLPGFDPVGLLVADLEKNFKGLTVYYDKYNPTALHFKDGDEAALRAFCKNLII